MDGSVVGENLREGRKKRRVVHYGAQFRGEMDRFGGVLKKSHEAQQKLEKENLAMKEQKLQSEKRMHATGRMEQGRERNEKREERAQDQMNRKRLEMETFSVLIDMISNLKT